MDKSENNIDFHVAHFCGRVDAALAYLSSGVFGFDYAIKLAKQLESESNQLVEQARKAGADQKELWRALGSLHGLLHG